MQSLVCDHIIVFPVGPILFLPLPLLTVTLPTLLQELENVQLNTGAC